MPSVLIVEDDRNSAEMLAELCQADGYVCSIATDLADARQQLVVHDPDVVLLDLHLPDGSGLDLFGERADDTPRPEIVLITGNASVETSIQALRLGAADYLIKPIGAAMLSRVLARALSEPPAIRTAGGHAETRSADGAEASRPRENRPGRTATSGIPTTDTPSSEGFCGMRGRSAAMLRIFEQIGKVARTSVSVLIVGESGTGKELVAQAVHHLSRRARGPFKAINCGAISQQLIESELFGHEKGSFTGAIKQHKGIFEQADGGTLFLDEITEMPAELQVRLLRVLETGTFTRVGSTSLLHTDVRVIAATNRDPLQAVSEGVLREDLFYRLNVFQVRVPPLRERAEDIDEIAEHFLALHNQRENRSLRFTRRALEALKSYAWPGNVRELRNIVDRTAILAEGEEIAEIMFPDGSFTLGTQQSLPDRTGSTSAREGHRPTITLAIGTTIADAERALILATLDHNGGSKETTAEMLGVSMKTLYNRLRAYRVD